MIDLKAVTAPERKMATRANGIKAKMSTADSDSKGEPTEIAATADEYVFWRPPSHVSALGSYGLRELLEQHGVKSLLLAGFSTSGCVINTAKQAADSGFITTVISDTCGDKSEEAHRVIMERLLIGQCHVVEEEVFINTWDGDLTRATEQMAITGS
jgi:nicotinamidase-related amidase